MKPPATADLASPAAPTSSPPPAFRPLVFQRLRPGDGQVPPGLLGGRWVGDHPLAVRAPLLSATEATFDAWSVDDATVDTNTAPRALGCVQYRCSGEWLHGMAVIDDRSIGLQGATQRAYDDIFKVLAANQCPQLLRIWNYLPDINLETDGSERYRQFNAGRQLAFIEAQRSAFDGAPAACALGTQSGPLQVYFLAGRHAPIAVENPRQVSAYRYPDTYGPRAPTFSRGALADLGGGRTALFISGTASIVGHESVHQGQVARQTEESLVNIAAVRQAASASSGLGFAAGELHYTVYLRHPDDLPAVREIFEQAIGPASPAARDAIYLHADICRADLLVEIEAHGFACTRSTS